MVKPSTVIVFILLIFQFLSVDNCFALVGKNVSSRWNKDLQAIVSVNGTCTGTLIDFETVITAAHCIQGTDVQKVFISLEQSGTIEFQVKTQILPHRYSQFMFIENNDIAILKISAEKLKHEFPNIHPIPIANYKNFEFPRPLIFAGFGREKLNENNHCVGPVSEDLNWVKLPVEIKPKKKQMSGSLWTNFKFLNVSLCNGDSGSPAIVKTANDEYVIIGVLSDGRFEEATFTLFNDDNIAWLKKSEKALIQSSNRSPYNYKEFNVGEDIWTSENVADLDADWNVSINDDNYVCYLEVFWSDLPLLLKGDNVNFEKDNQVISKEVDCQSKIVLSKDAILNSAPKEFSSVLAEKIVSTTGTVLEERLPGFRQIQKAKTLSWQLNIKDLKTNQFSVLRSYNCTYFIKDHTLMPYRTPNMGHHCFPHYPTTHPGLIIK